MSHAVGNTPCGHALRRLNSGQIGVLAGFLAAAVRLKLAVVNSLQHWRAQDNWSECIRPMTLPEQTFLSTWQERPFPPDETSARQRQLAPPPLCPCQRYDPSGKLVQGAGVSDQLVNLRHLPPPPEPEERANRARHWTRGADLMCWDEQVK
eukprot:2046680-Amphidinium_carterae.2